MTSELAGGALSQSGWSEPFSSASRCSPVSTFNMSLAFSPYLLLLACPLMHFFGHGHGHSHHSEHSVPTAAGPTSNQEETHGH